MYKKFDLLFVLKSVNRPGIAGLFKKNGITSVHGHGTIVTPNQVIVKNNDGGRTTINTKNILVATGSEVTPFPGIEVYSLCLHCHDRSKKFHLAFIENVF